MRTILKILDTLLQFIICAIFLIFIFIICNPLAWFGILILAIAIKIIMG